MCKPLDKNVPPGFSGSCSCPGTPSPLRRRGGLLRSPKTAPPLTGTGASYPSWDASLCPVRKNADPHTCNLQGWSLWSPVCRCPQALDRAVGAAVFLGACQIARCSGFRKSSPRLKGLFLPLVPQFPHPIYSFPHSRIVFISGIFFFQSFLNVIHLLKRVT